MSSNVQALLATTLADNGYELIEAEYVRARGLWRVFIDRAASRRGVDLITVDDCSAMTAHILDVFEAEGVDYEFLEVSSPGVDRALTKADHFERFAGEQVRLTLEPPFGELRKVSGELVGLNEGEVVLNVDGVERRVPYANVSRARVIPQF